MNTPNSKYGPEQLAGQAELGPAFEVLSGVCSEDPTLVQKGEDTLFFVSGPSVYVNEADLYNGSDVLALGVYSHKPDTEIVLAELLILFRLPGDHVAVYYSPRQPQDQSWQEFLRQARGEISGADESRMRESMANFMKYSLYEPNELVEPLINPIASLESLLEDAERDEREGIIEGLRVLRSMSEEELQEYIEASLQMARDLQVWSRDQRHQRGKEIDKLKNAVYGEPQDYLLKDDLARMLAVVRD